MLPVPDVGQTLPRRSGFSIAHIAHCGRCSCGCARQRRAVLEGSHRGASQSSPGHPFSCCGASGPTLATPHPDVVPWQSRSRALAPPPIGWPRTSHRDVLPHANRPRAPAVAEDRSWPSATCTSCPAHERRTGSPAPDMQPRPRVDTGSFGPSPRHASTQKGDQCATPPRLPRLHGYEPGPVSAPPWPHSRPSCVTLARLRQPGREQSTTLHNRANRSASNTVSPGTGWTFRGPRSIFGACAQEASGRRIHGRRLSSSQPGSSLDARLRPHPTIGHKPAIPTHHASKTLHATPPGHILDRRSSKPHHRSPHHNSPHRDLCHRPTCTHLRATRL